LNTPNYEEKDLLSIPEGKTFDRKSATYDLNKLANILIAFANADGGTVALGIKDKKYEGINLLSSQKKNDILQIGSQRVVPTLEIEKNVKYVLNRQGLSDEIWLLTVLPTDNKLYMNKRDEVYLRLGDETHHATFEERKNLEFDKGIREFESQAIDEAILDDLDSETVEKYKKLYGFDGDNLWDLLFPTRRCRRSPCCNWRRMPGFRTV